MKEAILQLHAYAKEFRTGTLPNGEEHAKTMEAIAGLLGDLPSEPPGAPPDCDPTVTQSGRARMLTDHKLNGLNDAIVIAVVDEAGPGGANHEYVLTLTGSVTARRTAIHFQNGPIGATGANGFSNEALLAIVIDRMRGFQYGRDAAGTFQESMRGKYACRENALALTHLEDALHWLQDRTRRRLARGVEGTHTV